MLDEGLLLCRVRRAGVSGHRFHVKAKVLLVMPDAPSVRMLSFWRDTKYEGDAADSWCRQVLDFWAGEYCCMCLVGLKPQQALKPSCSCTILYR